MQLISDRPRGRTSASSCSGFPVGALAQEIRPTLLQHLQLFLCYSSHRTHRRDNLHILVKCQNLRNFHLSHSSPQFLTFLDSGPFDSSLGHTHSLWLTCGQTEPKGVPSAWLNAAHPSVPPEMSPLQGRLPWAWIFVTCR